MARPRATTVDEVVNAAARVFERKGYDLSTMGDIADEVQITKPTLYHYAPNKQWLLETLVDRILYPLELAVAEILESDGPPAEKLERYVELSVRSAVRLQTYYTVLFSEQSQLPRLARERFRAWAHDT